MPRPVIRQITFTLNKYTGGILTSCTANVTATGAGTGTATVSGAESGAP